MAKAMTRPFRPITPTTPSVFLEGVVALRSEPFNQPPIMQQNEERQRAVSIILKEIERWKIQEANQSHDEMMACGCAIGALSNVLCTVMGFDESLVVEVDGVVRGRYRNALDMANHFGAVLQQSDAMRKELEELRGIVNL